MIHHLLIFWQRKLEDSYHENHRLQTKLEESDRINRELLALSNRQASTIRSLIKAGDATSQRLHWFCRKWGWKDDDLKTLTPEWEAAKEGQQS